MKKHHTKTKGDIGVLKAQCELAIQGFTILNPLTEHSSYDLVAEKDGNFKRVQVKYRSLEKDGAIRVSFTSSWADKNGSHTNKVDKSLIDLYAVYCPETDKVYFFNPSDFKEHVTLRVNAPKNNQSIGINLAEDFLCVP